ncbi:MAG: hypothetical protein FWD68_12320 [Alphaproteobacteria bacterium]|nr:hypothetical protein [Alphaproteobacteria bacterium]
MTIDHERNALIAAIRNRIDVILEMRLASCAGRPEYAHIDFDAALPVIAAIETLLGHLSRSQFGYVTAGSMTMLDGALRNVCAVFDQIRALEQKADSCAEVRAAGVEETAPTTLEVRRENVMEAVFAVLPRRKPQRERKVTRPGERSVQRNGRRGAGNQDLPVGPDPVVAFEQAAVAAVARQAGQFRQQAGEHQRMGTRWLTATILAAGATVAWAVGTLWWVPVRANVRLSEVLQQGMGKMAVLALLGLAVLWSARNYAGHRHNYVVNRDRETQFGSLDSLVKAADQDVAVRNAILMEASSSIFAPRGTGYGGRRDGESAGSTRIIQIMQPFADESSSR